MNPFNQDEETREQALESFQIDSQQNKNSVLYITPTLETEVILPTESYGLSIFMDLFGYIVINLFAIGLMRFLFFVAMKSSKTLGEIGGRIDEFGRNVMGSLPIVPIPGASGPVGIKRLGM